MIRPEEKEYYKRIGRKPPSYGMSLMWQDIIWGSFFLALFLAPFLILHILKLPVNMGFDDYDYFLVSLLSHVFTAALLYIKSTIIHDKIGKYLGIAYKIIERDTSKGIYYYAKVLKPTSFMFFWIWKPVDPWKSSYDSEDSARSAIDTYKRKSKSARLEYSKKVRLERVRKIRV